ncbi:MAG TPA: hypothetical protein VGS79_01010 [Puia sp.]|nr:hypothetical protein [Puia sp.]
MSSNSVIRTAHRFLLIRRQGNIFQAAADFRYIHLFYLIEDADGLSTVRGKWKYIVPIGGAEYLAFINMEMGNANISNSSMPVCQAKRCRG